MANGDIDPSEVDPYLKPRVAGLVVPPTGPGAPSAEIDPADVDPYIAGPITSHDNPAFSRSKEPAWFPYVDEPAKVAAQIGGEIGGGLLGGMVGTVEAPAVGTVGGAGAGSVVGAGTGEVAEEYGANAIKRAMGYDPDPVDPKEAFKSGAEASLIGRYAVPALVRYVGEPTVKYLFGVNQMNELGQAAVDAAAKAKEDQLVDVGTAHHKAAPVMEEAKESGAAKYLAERAQQEFGATAETGQAKLASTGTEAGQQAYAIEHRAVQRAAVDPANRSFEKTGQQIGEAWQPYRGTTVGTAHFDDTVNEILHPGAGQKPPGNLTKPVSDLLERFNIYGQQGHALAGDILDMNRDAQLLAGRTKSPADQFALARMREQFMGILSDNEVVPPEGKAILQPLNDLYSAKKDWIQGKDFTALKATANPGDTFERMTKLPGEGMNAILQEATPDELNRIRQGAAQYIAGRDPENAKGILDRVDKFYGENPTAYHKLFAGTPWDDPRKLARAPLYAARAMGAMKDPKFQKYIAAGADEAMNDPSVRQLQRELEKYHAMPDPESQRGPGMMKLMEEGAGSRGPGQRFWGYVQRRMMFDGMVTIMSGGQYGMLARHPLLAAGMGGLLASRAYGDYLMMKDPEAYWNFVSKAAGVLNSRSAIELGRATARLGIVAAIDAMHQKAAAATAAASAGTPERVEGTDPNAVAVP